MGEFNNMYIFKRVTTIQKLSINRGTLPIRITNMVTPIKTTYSTRPSATVYTRRAGEPMKIHALALWRPNRHDGPSFLSLLTLYNMAQKISI